MKLPDGRECPYYYADYYRRAAGIEKCLLLEGKSDSNQWRPELCHACPVPNYRRANSCSNMYFVARIKKRSWRFWRPDHIQIRIYCKLSGGEVANPLVGCGQCHTPINFTVSDDTPKT